MFNKAFYDIKRETSQYNKYLKWHVTLYREDMSVLSSQYFKTEREAQAHIDRTVAVGKDGFPIGNKVSYTEYRRVGSYV